MSRDGVAKAYSKNIEDDDDVSGFNDLARWGFTYVRDWGAGLDATNKAILYVWAKDKDHAIKIANERRIQILAENMWGIDD